jgi:ribosomal protein L14E/L6E/L27E
MKKAEVEIGIGSVGYSKAGRDIGNCYLVVAADKEGYFLLSDGKTRPIAKPKRKNIRHLKIKGDELPVIKEKLLNKKQVFDSEIRSALRAFKVEQ